VPVHAHMTESRRQRSGLLASAFSSVHFQFLNSPCEKRRQCAGAAVPSDQLATGIMYSVIGSGAP